MGTLDLYFSITCLHPFYQGIIPLQLALLNTDVQRRYDLVIRRRGNVFYIYGSSKKKESFYREFTATKIIFPKLLLERDHLSLADDAILELKFNVIDVNFHYVTKDVMDLSKKEVVNYYQDDILCVLGNIDLLFSVKSKKLEFFIEGKSDLFNYRLQEVNDKLAFEKIDSDKHVAHFRSSQYVDLKSQYDYQLKLVEQTKFGEKIVLNKVSLPEVNSLSSHFPYDTITRYYTF